MKKILMIAMTAVMGLAMVSCNKAAKNTEEQAEQVENACCAEESACCAECPLTGEWTIESVGELAAVEEMNKPALTIENGQVGGQTGCNSFSGSVKCCPKSKRVKFGEMAVTKMACQETEAQEAAILAAFANAATFALEEDVLTLKDAEDVVLMTLKKL